MRGVTGQRLGLFLVFLSSAIFITIVASIKSVGSAIRRASGIRGCGKQNELRLRVRGREELRDSREASYIVITLHRREKDAVRINRIIKVAVGRW